MAQGVGPELKPQYHKKQTNKKLCTMHCLDNKIFQNVVGKYKSITILISDNLKTKTLVRVGDVAQVVENLSSKCKVLSSSPNPAKNNNN
jgi:hypothetical protein